MEFKEAVLSAIKDYEGESEAVRYEVLGVEIYQDLPKGVDAVDYDGEVGWNYNGENDEEYEVYACVLHKGDVIHATLLRSVGKERKDGTAYGGLDAWLPKNAFGVGIWSREQQVQLLQKRFAEINDDRLFFYHVRVITDE
jgi:hypothetical protein